MLKPGYTLMHEHVILDLSEKKQNDDCNYNDFENLVSEYKKLYDLGVRNVVDVTTFGMGRKPEYVEQIIKETNMNIISSTGLYQETYLPPMVDELTTNELAEFFMDEINNQIEDSKLKAQIIGEIATSKNQMTPREAKVFEAAIIAHKKTGIKITTHTTLGTYGLEQVEFFKKHNVDLNNVVIGHVDLSGDIDYILNIINQGAYVSFDTVGKINYLKDEIRVDMLKILQDKDLLHKVFLSMDITRKSNLNNNGGIGYSYLFTTFLDMMLEGGITKENIELMLNTNPQVFFKGQEK